MLDVISVMVSLWDLVNFVPFTTCWTHFPHTNSHNAAFNFTAAVLHSGESVLIYKPFFDAVESQRILCFLTICSADIQIQLPQH